VQHGSVFCCAGFCTAFSAKMSGVKSAHRPANNVTGPAVLFFLNTDFFTFFQKMIIFLLTLGRLAVNRLQEMYTK
jgi:hypothetical protein